MSRRDLRIAIRLWRNGRDAGAGRSGGQEAAARALGAMLLHLCALQRELDRGISRCPGRSVVPHPRMTSPKAVSERIS